MFNSIRLLILLTAIWLIALSSCSTEKTTQKTIYNIEGSREGFRIMFYNVENLFDTENDPDKRDDDFTPDGARAWTNFRYQTKLRQIYQVIVAVGGWDLPEIVGICEIENRFVLEEVIRRTSLYSSDYKIIHYESPDNRGIDVALFYRETKFTPILHYPIAVNFPEHLSKRPTRDILYVKGVSETDDTLHIFVNHWPSKFGGEMETKPLRMYCGELVRTHVDSIFNINQRANIIIMGDFNDEPESRCIIESLNAEYNFSGILPQSLYNLSYHLKMEKRLGTLKFRGQWGLIDQFIVSGALLDTLNNIYTSKEHVHIFKADWLTEKDERYGGYQPYRTYIGFRYHGGFSDHYPTYLDLIGRKQE